jgi:hypothetical protein
MRQFLLVFFLIANRKFLAIKHVNVKGNLLILFRGTWVGNKREFMVTG